ncbi:unnamed protein product, partial [marine sediment metagenome]
LIIWLNRWCYNRYTNRVDKDEKIIFLDMFGEFEQHVNSQQFTLENGYKLHINIINNKNLRGKLRKGLIYLKNVKGTRYTYFILNCSNDLNYKIL